MPAITLQDVYRARKTIQPVAVRTPLVIANTLSQQVGAAVHLKLETVQETGAFKLRGAANKILNLSAAEKERGVVTVSTGNHGRAVACVAAKVGLKAAVCISRRVPDNKVAALRALGAEVVIHGDSQDEAGEMAERLQAERGLTMVPPFDDPWIIAGQGTIGLEILEDRPEVDTVLVPLSGGGLIAGVALALKSASPHIRVLGISMERGPVMYHSLQAGRPVQLAEEETLADSLSGGIGLNNQYTFEMVRQYVDDVILVSEEDIAQAMAYALTEERLVVEGAGAVGIAALLSGKATGLGQNIALVLSGANVAVPTVLQLVAEQTAV